MQFESNIPVREANIGDREAIKFLSQSDREFKGILSHSALSRYIHDRRVLIAEIDRCIVGCIFYRYARTSQTLITRICISDFYRSVGVEYRLMKMLKYNSIMHGKKHICAKAPANSVTNGWYQSCGFCEQEWEAEKTYRFWILSWIA